MTISDYELMRLEAHRTDDIETLRELCLEAMRERQEESEVYKEEIESLKSDIADLEKDCADYVRMSERFERGYRMWRERAENGLGKYEAEFTYSATREGALLLVRRSCSATVYVQGADDVAALEEQLDFCTDEIETDRVISEYFDCQACQDREETTKTCDLKGAEQ